MSKVIFHDNIYLVMLNVVIESVPLSDDTDDIIRTNRRASLVCRLELVHLIFIFDFECSSYFAKFS